MSSPRVDRAVIAFAAALAVLLTVGVAAASVPDGTGTIHGCFKKSGGDVRIIDPSAGESCGSSELPISWLQAGPQGSQGQIGDKGVQGQPGPAGLSGLTQDPKTMVVGDTAFADPVIGGFFKEVSCPEGTKVLWGAWSWELFISPKPPGDMESFPLSDDSWGFAVGASSQSKGTVASVFIGCAIAQ